MDESRGGLSAFHRRCVVVLNIRPCCAEENLGFIGDLAGNPAGGQ
jgi:hypothetical protein